MMFKLYKSLDYKNGFISNGILDKITCNLCTGK